jgi:hypothetical protein
MVGKDASEGTPDYVSDVSAVQGRCDLGDGDPVMELRARFNTTDQYIKPATDFFEAVEQKLDGTLPASRRGSIKHWAADEDNSKVSNKDNAHHIPTLVTPKSVRLRHPGSV